MIQHSDISALVIIKILVLSILASIYSQIFGFHSLVQFHNKNWDAHTRLYDF